MNAPGPLHDWTEANQQLLVAEFARLKALLAGEPIEEARQRIEMCRAALRCAGRDRSAQRALRPVHLRTRRAAARRRRRNGQRTRGPVRERCRRARRMGDLRPGARGVARAALERAHADAAAADAGACRGRRRHRPGRGAPAHRRACAAFHRRGQRPRHAPAPAAARSRPSRPRSPTRNTLPAVRSSMPWRASPNSRRRRWCSSGATTPMASATSRPMSQRAPGLTLYAMAAADMPAARVRRRGARHRCGSVKPALLDGALLVELGDASAATPGVRRFVEQATGLVLRGAARTRRVATVTTCAIAVDKPDGRDQRRLWQRLLDRTTALLAGTLDDAGRAVPPERATMCARRRPGSPPTPAGDPVRRTAASMPRARRRRLDGLAQRIEPGVGWDDLVLPAAQLQTLRQIASPRAPPCDRLRALGLRRRRARAGLGIGGAVRRRERHRQDHGRRGAGARTRAGPVPHRPRGGRQQVHRRDREEPARASSTPPRTAARSCCSTRPMRCSASAARSRTATTATPTSRSATCCSAWRPTDGLAILTTNLKAALDTGVPAAPALRRRASRSPMQRERREIWRACLPGRRRRLRGSTRPSSRGCT